MSSKRTIINNISQDHEAIRDLEVCDVCLENFNEGDSIVIDDSNKHYHTTCYVERNR